MGTNVMINIVSLTQPKIAPFPFEHIELFKV